MNRVLVLDWALDKSCTRDVKELFEEVDQETQRSVLLYSTRNLYHSYSSTEADPISLTDCAIDFSLNNGM
jgi:hypothetical protein